jgi:hypothetical protein
MAYSFQMKRDTHKYSLNSLTVHYERQIIVAKIPFEAFTSSLLESIVLVLIS